jgi:glycerol uptake facilitator-like aquaporin
MRVFVAGGSTEFTGFYNPAVALAGAVVGDIGWTRMLVCISAEMVGGFVAAILIWFTYLPHFQPLEFVQQGDDSLCNCCDLETGGVAVIKQELSEQAHRYLLSHIFKIICNMRPNIPVMMQLVPKSSCNMRNSTLVSAVYPGFHKQILNHSNLAAATWCHGVTIHDTLIISSS